MKEKSMTALICAFSRAYHSKNNSLKIFDDNIAEKLLTESEYNNICKNMSEGIRFFNKDFTGNSDEALKWIVNNHLAPTPLGRGLYSEKLLEVSVKTGASQYIILGAGYDTFAYRQPKWGKNIEIFEIDRADMIEDKKRRISNANINIPSNLHYISADLSENQWYKKLTENRYFNKNKISFCNMSGFTYYITNENFEEIIKYLSDIFENGSSIFFDYPNKETSEKSHKQKVLADGANEKMKFALSYRELEKLLEKYNLLIYEHLNSDEITNRYFNDYNRENPLNEIREHKNVSYCLCVKRDN